MKTKRFLALLLTVCMLVGVIPAQAYAAFVTDESGEIVKTANLSEEGGTIIGMDADGNETEIQYDSESWEEAYPYGAFAFSETGVTVEEGAEDEAVIKVYRLGGTKGRATAYLTYQPVVSQTEDGEAYYGYGISADDLDILVEEPQPIAEYQEVGKDPEPEVTEEKIMVTQDEEGYILSVSESLQGVRWQVYDSNGWNNIYGSDGVSTDVGYTIPVDAEDYEDCDFRVIFEDADGVTYCTDTAKGEVYVKEEDYVPTPWPEDGEVELNAEPVYTALDLRGEGVDKYAGWIFELIFAENEWVKEIHISTKDFDNDISQGDRGALFTIKKSYGGEVLSAASTLLLHMSDNDQAGSSEVGFEVSSVVVDKAEGTAEINVTRSGDCSTPVTLEWATADGTAVAGTDYIEDSGSLLFYNGLETLPIKVELIDDGVSIDEDDALYFTIKLSNLLGGNDTCSLGTKKAKVYLWNSTVNENPNLATMLYDANSVDVSDKVVEGEAVVTADEAAVGQQQVIEEEEATELALDFSADELDSQLYQGKDGNGVIAKISFSGGTWDKVVDFASVKDNWTVGNVTSKKDYSNETNYIVDKYSETKTWKCGNRGNYEFKVDSDLQGVAILTKGDGKATLTGYKYRDNAGNVKNSNANSNTVLQMFGSYNTNFIVSPSHGTSVYKGINDYRYSYSMTRVTIAAGSSKFVNNPKYINRLGSGALDKNWNIYCADSDFTESKYATNPYSYSEYYQIPAYYSNEAFDVTLNIPYQGDSDGAHNKLNDSSLIWMKKLEMVRRTFDGNFSLEICTPNDANAVSGQMAKLTDYSGFTPTVSFTGGQSYGHPYVGSTVTITPNGLPAGYYIDKIFVYQNTGSGWNLFNKFSNCNIASGGKSATIQLLAGSGSTKEYLSSTDLSANYRFRVVYARTAKITVDLSPSVPRLKSDTTGKTIDSTRILEALTGYNDSDKVKYGFSSAKSGAGVTVSPKVTVKYSTWEGAQDYTSSLQTTTVNKPTTATGLYDSTSKTGKWTFEVKNAQMVNFGLPHDDILLVNGHSYHGDEDIYLTLDNIAGGITVLYYNKSFQTAISAMTTAIKWMAVYWDANGNGQIDGYYNQSNDTFTLTAVSGVKDEFCGYIDVADSVNETMLAPKLNASKYCDYFIKYCYTMTPRALVVPSGANSTDKAQIMPAFYTSLPETSAAYAQLTDELKSYRYVVSGKTVEKKGDTITFNGRSSDDHLMYTIDASAARTLDIPLGGDHSPAELHEATSTTSAYYSWDPLFYGNLLYPFEAPQLVTVENSVAGPTAITSNVAVDSESGVASYSGDGLKRMNGYLGSFTGNCTFVVVTQEQKFTTEEILAECAGGVTLGGGATNVSYDKLYVQSASDDYSVKPDSITLGGFSCTPDPTYLQEIQGDSNKENNTKGDVDMSEDKDNEMSEFSVDLGIELGSFDIPITDYVTIAFNENQIGFSISIPLGSLDENGVKDNFKDANKDQWTQFSDFFNSSNFGDDGYNAAKKDKQRVDTSNANHRLHKERQTSQPNPSKYKSKDFEVSFSFGLAFMWEYNPLDNGYYFEGMTVSLSGELSYRVTARLTVCPIVYCYVQLSVGIELTTGLGVNREGVELAESDLYEKSGALRSAFTEAIANHCKTQQFDYSTAAEYSKRLFKTYYTSSAKATGSIIISNTSYNMLKSSEQKNYTNLVSGSFWWNSKSYKTEQAAIDAYFEMGKFYLTEEQYTLLGKLASGKADYKTSDFTLDSGYYYNNKNYASYQKAKEAYIDANAIVVDLDYKAFNLRFEGKVSVEVTELTLNNGTTVTGDAIEKEYGFISGTLSSDGSADTQVVLRQQDGMLLSARDEKGDKDKTNDVKSAKVIIRALDVKSDSSYDVTSLIKFAQLRAITNDVYWKGISIAPSIAVEAGAGVGVELMKLELYLHINVGAGFLLGVYQTNYNPNDFRTDNDKKYKAAEVESFEAGIGIGLRVVLLAFSFELDACSYNISYENGEWEHGWTFLNGWVQALEEEGYTGVTIRFPQATDQQVYTPAENGAIPDSDELSTQSISITDIPFELTSEKGNVSASALTDNTMSGSDYRLFSVGDRDFMLYTMSRTDCASVDAPMLVLSELKLVGGAYGLVNPVDNSNAAVKYIIVDDDGTGDLDFDVVSNASGASITWVSYDKEGCGTVTKPASSRYSVNVSGSAVTMNIGNYNTIAAPTTTDAAINAQYNEWKAYYSALASSNANAQASLANAAKCAELKTATFSADTNALSITTKLYGDGKDGSANYIFAPTSDGNAVAFGTAKTLDTTGSTYGEYVDYLNNIGVLTGSSIQAYGDYLKQTKKSQIDVFGTQSALCVSVDGVIRELALSSGQTIGNIELQKIGGNYYIAYTASTDAYVGSGTTLDPYDMVTETGLYLVKFDPSTKNFGTPYLLRAVRDYDQNTGNDGVYSKGASVADKTYDSPYITNLQFLTANIDPDTLTGGETLTPQTLASHSFLLFEMNGTTYLTLDESIEKLAIGTAGTLYPFFTGEIHTNADGTQVQETASGKQDVTIGVDANGNVFAVYTAAVQNAGGNALWLSVYDAAAGKWSEGTILAMNDLDVYETSVKYSWDDDTTEAAYLGIGANGLSDDDLTHLYGKEGANIKSYLNSLKAVDKKVSELGKLESFSFSAPQVLAGQDDNGKNLLIVSSGTLTELAVTALSTGANAEYTIMPKYDSNDSMVTKSGVYAISYGKGDAGKLGEASVAFGYGVTDFSAGSSLCVYVSATNTGDTLIPYDNNKEPIKAELYLEGSVSQSIIAEWEITENIYVGQQIDLNGYTNALGQNLPDGTTFNLRIVDSNDKSYIAENLFKVEKKPDLAVENLNVNIASITKDKTVLNVEFDATNRGSGKAEGVYVQFQYGSGSGSDVQYSSLNISQNTLEVGKASPVSQLDTQAVTQNRLSEGVLYIYNSSDGNNSLETGKYRHVSGTITVPASVFAGGESDYLDLKVEIFGDTSTVNSMSVGALNATHGEYYSANNLQTQAVQAVTDYTVAPSIVIPLGTTTLIPISAVSSRGTAPVLAATEINDLDGTNIGILNFKQTGEASKGSISGVVSITPTTAGTGVIHVTDADTGSYTAIAFIVTDASEGIDIYNDNGSFSFYKSNGTLATDKNNYDGWEFGNAAEWGIGSAAEVPMRNNLATGKQDSYFTFNTVAESFKLWFNGSISVESDYPGFKTKTFTGAGGNNPVTVTLGQKGSNAKYESHSVTIRVKGTKAEFDRLVEVYPEGQVPVPSYDGSSPLLIWSRSFPATASISASSGTKIPVTVYAFDNSGLATLTITDPKGSKTSFNTGSVESSVFKKLDGDVNRLWSFSFGNISANGTYNISLTDNGGNTINTQLIVDWFNETVSGNTDTVTVPEYDADFYVGEDKWNGNALGKDDMNKGLDIRFAKSGTKDANKYSVSNYSETTLNFSENSNTDSKFDISTGNGYYWTICSASDNTWSAEVLYMDKIDETLPNASLTYNAETGKLDWNAYKNSAASGKIEKVTVNGVNVKGSMANAVTLGGSVEIFYNGDYTIYAQDTAKNSATQQITVSDLKLNIDACQFSSDRAWNQAKDNGSIAVDLNGIYGAKYVASGSINGVAFSNYKGAYETSIYKVPEKIVVDPTTIVVNVDDISGYSAMTPEEKGLAEEARWNELYNAAVLEATSQSAIALAAAKADAENSFVTVGTGLKHNFTDLTPGDYVVIIRDKNDTANSKEVALTVEDKAISVDVFSFNSSKPDSSDGEIIVAINESDTAALNYSILPYVDYEEPAEGEPATVADEALFKSLASAENPIVWQAAENDSVTDGTTFGNLKSGWYVVAVRGAYYGPTAGAIAAELNTACDDVLNAQAELNAAENDLVAANEELKQKEVTLTRAQNELRETSTSSTQYADLQQAVTDAQADVDQANLAITSASAIVTDAQVKLAEKQTALGEKRKAAAAAVDAFYADHPEYAEAIHYVLVQVGANPVSPVAPVTSNIKSVASGENTVVFSLVDSTEELTDADCFRIASSNKDSNVVITGDGLSIYIPAGTLENGDGSKVNSMIVDPSLARDGMVIRYTDEDGKSVILPWGLVGNGSASYLAMGKGTYEIVKNEVSFTDLDGAWGREAIEFCARRNLVAGVGSGRFAPEDIMTRAMMVTVFWSIDGKDMSYASSVFDDLEAEWYRYSAGWGAANHITSGVSETKFAPELPVTREQMCVFFVNFMNYLEMNLDKKLEPIMFSDRDEISSWAVDFVDFCTSVKLISGVGSNRFAPQNCATRMQVCTIMDLFITNIVGKYCPAPVKAAQLSGEAE